MRCYFLMNPLYFINSLMIWFQLRQNRYPKCNKKSKYYRHICTIKLKPEELCNSLYYHQDTVLREYTLASFNTVGYSAIKA